MAHPARTNPHLPVPPIARVARPLARFLRIESASGIVLLLCTVIALALANSTAADAYHRLWHTHVQLEVGTFKLGGELGHFFVNDVLMTVFFFVVGLEIKRELVAGELRDARKAALPVAAALGGMLVPAGIYMALQANALGRPEFRGWGVPMATDIAFVVGVMAVLGKRVPLGLKIMLLSLAIADDIGAVVVIAAFYSTGLDWLMLLLAAGGFAAVRIMNATGVRSVPVYTIIGAGIWLAVYKSGVHPTVAGVLLGLLTPSEVWIGRDALRLSLRDVLGRVEDENDDPDAHELAVMAFAAQESVSPLERLEHKLHPWVGFAIMPLFALANAGVHIEPSAVTEPVAIAVALGLLLGKPIGVVLFSFIAVRLGVARLPQGVTWPVLLGGGLLAGIGFTMSLFVAGLAFEGHALLLAEAKIGILLGSALSALFGTGVLLTSLRGNPQAKSPH
ncbi:Na(+)/H(+) antiporter NhaA [Gemmata obscuriglobus]|uniref:Na(+)/H(+) antiporter NhaA n=1 Tax=Gemmata obscuriglobus TaxID=114 RepID=A0A2Z3GSF4_9BACT|nr:Na+/H+ antiporter NhaA [Gemmata obscuriglobus]AWM36278.1 Na+/H+ antiporter NhaA [Gemmata obscuriglobus]QEG31117.1 Na(+)/H(+) antiporter NhaA [Gemmata obscuriglobus]VTS10454.1 sodium:proton antiporter : Na(+)/H(+) antiporter NhaA OS=Isosphaera pallida (strain ATCC 43644 / DSM 9630 / IS1B) GN=nhaA PE=3 SV=1: Na_H_antiport_1 [Gemmata obscuriglobus UQM 2246]